MTDSKRRVLMVLAVTSSLLSPAFGAFARWGRPVAWSARRGPPAVVVLARREREPAELGHDVVQLFCPGQVHVHTALMGFIVALDAVVYARSGGASLLARRPRQMVALIASSPLSPR